MFTAQQLDGPSGTLIEVLAGGLPGSSGNSGQQIDGETLSESLAPAINEKLMNTIQLKRIAGHPLSEEEQNQMTNLAFACPLEAGNAVYRARSVLRTQGNYTFDDTANCEPDKESGDGKEEGGIKRQIPNADIETPLNQWRIYPNPARHRLWIAGNRIEELESIQLLNGFGQTVLHQNNKADTPLEIHLPTELKAGIYFLRLQLRDGELYTHKILLQP